MSNGLHELLKISEDGVHRLIIAVKVMVVVFVLIVMVWISSDIVDRLNGSSPLFAVQQIVNEVRGQRSAQEKEALALLNYSVGQTGLTRLRALRVGLASHLSDSGAQARFNGASFRISLSVETLGRDVWEQRWVTLHEIGHAVAKSTLRSSPYALPNWHLSESAKNTLEKSIVYQQMYSESFADLFALAISLRLDQEDPMALKQLHHAQLGRLEFLSMAHDTSEALRLAQNRLWELRTKSGKDLLGLLDVLASEGALRGVSAWGAEREAMCSEGAWGWVSWTHSEGHMIASFPWEMASSEIPSMHESHSKTLLELMSFRGEQGPYKRILAEKEHAAYLQEIRRINHKEQKNGGLAMSGFATQPAGSWGEALAREEWKTVSPTRRFFEPVARTVASLMGGDRPEGCGF